MTSTENLALPLVVHLRQDYEKFPNHQLVNDQLCKAVSCRRRRVRNWREFAEAIKEEVPSVITIYYKELTLADQQEPEKFINFVQGLIDYVGVNRLNGPPAIAIGIDETCTRNFINRLKLVPGIAGIYWADDQAGTERNRAHIAFLNGEQNWNLNVIDQLPAPTPISVYFREDWEKYMANFDKKHFESLIGMEVECCSSWHDLGKVTYKSPHQIIVHIDTIKKLNVTIPEVISMIDTRLKLSGLLIPVAVGIEPETSVSTIKELRQSGVFGIVPSAAHWGIEETVTAIQALRDRVPYWPKHILNQLPGNKPVAKSRNGIVLTARQQEVMDLVCHRGLSNKQIARALNLSESTVKIHVSAVMRSYGVRNRTQLALSAGTGLKA